MDLCQIWASYLRNFHLICIFCIVCFFYLGIGLASFTSLPPETFCIRMSSHWYSGPNAIGFLKLPTAKSGNRQYRSSCQIKQMFNSSAWYLRHRPTRILSPSEWFPNKMTKNTQQEQKITNSPAFLFIKSCKWWSNVFFFFPFKLLWLKWYLPSDLCFQRFQQTILCTSPTKWTISFKTGFWLWWWRNRWWWW